MIFGQRRGKNPGKRMLIHCECWDTGNGDMRCLASAASRRIDGSFEIKHDIQREARLCQRLVITGPGHNRRKRDARSPLSSSCVIIPARTVGELWVLTITCSDKLGEIGNGRSRLGR